MKVLHVVGARPNFMKIAPIMQEMAKYPQDFEQILVHTGQHYDDNMSKVFFEDLELPPPDIYLGVGSGSHAQQTAKIMTVFEPIIMEHKPDWIIVVGDVNSTLACALTAAKLGIMVVHVEAGLRSFDRGMPEEVNRVLTDHIADLLFTTEPSAVKNLRREGLSEEKIHFVGNVMIDILVRLLPKAKKRETVLHSRFNFKRYVLVTLHRPSNVDEPALLNEIMLTLSEIALEVPIIFPVHPRTRWRLEEIGYKIEENGNLCLTEPLGYLDFLSLMQSASLVITDSGGIQEETTFMNVPCFTVRPNTERPVTITHGTNRLIANERYAIVQATYEVLNSIHESSSVISRPELWDGHAAERIVNVFQHLEGKK